MLRGSQRAVRGALLATLAVAGCPSVPTPPEPAPGPEPEDRPGEGPFEARLRYAPGTPVSGGAPVTTRAVVDPAELAPGDGLALRVQAMVLPREPGDGLAPLVERSRLVVRSHGEQLLPLQPRLAAGTRTLRVEADDGEPLERLRVRFGRDPGRTVRFGDTRGVLPPGVTAAVDVLEAGASQELPGADPHPERVSVLASWPGPGSRAIEVAVEVVRSTHESAAVPLDRPEVELVLAEPLPLDRALVFAVPTPFLPGSAWGVALAVEAAPAPAPDAPDAVVHKEAFARFADALGPADFGGLARAAEEPPGAPYDAPPDVERALATLKDPARRRRALLALGELTKHDLVRSVASWADPRFLAEVARRVTEATLPDRIPGRLLKLGWILQTAVNEVLWDRIAAAEGAPPPIRAALIRYAGGAGAREEWFFSASRRARDVVELRRVLREENLLLLDDRDPALRVRAFEWLQERGLAPAGYDPLATDAKRATRLDEGADGAGGRLRRLEERRRAEMPSEQPGEGGFEVAESADEPAGRSEREGAARPPPSDTEESGPSDTDESGGSPPLPRDPAAREEPREGVR